jgi:hypothetical protein
MLPKRLLLLACVEKAARDADASATQLLKHLQRAWGLAFKEIVEGAVGEFVLVPELLDSQALSLGGSPDVLRDGPLHRCPGRYSNILEQRKGAPTSLSRRATISRTYAEVMGRPVRRSDKAKKPVRPLPDERVLIVVERIEESRKKLKMNLPTMCAKAGISPATWHSWKAKGRSDEPGLHQT